MFRIASSLGTASRGIASLWLQRDSVKYQQNIEKKEEVNKEVGLEQHKLHLNENELDIHLVIDDKQREIVIDEASLAKDEIDSLRIAPDSQDNEIQLLKAKLKLMEEKNAKLEEEKLKQDASLQQQQIESNATIASLRNLLVPKNEEIVGLKADARKAREQFQVCAEELAASKNQLLYKHLALDGIIKSNIKLQEQLEPFHHQSKESQEVSLIEEKVSNGGSSVNQLDACQKKQASGRQQRRRRRNNRKSKKNNKSSDL